MEQCCAVLSLVQNQEEVSAAVAELMAMGFEHDLVVQALRAAYNNPQRAADYLLSVRGSGCLC